MAYRRAHIPRFTPESAAMAARDVVVLTAVQVKLFADAQSRAFQRRIYAQTFPSFHSHPLQPSTLAAKRRMHLSSRVMMATRQYVDSIDVQKRLAGRKTTWFIGHDDRRLALDPRTHNPRRGVTLAMLARMHELAGGKAEYPARPHWGPALEAMRGKAGPLRDRIRRMAMYALRARLGIGHHR